MSDAPAPAVRLDRWLWAARFFRSRSSAQAAVEGGKVHLDGRRVKAARAVRVGDRLEITRGEEHFEVQVLGLAQRRGPAREAQQLYQETPGSAARREARRRERALRRAAVPQREGRPSKRDRRELARLRRRASDGQP